MVIAISKTVSHQVPKTAQNQLTDEAIKQIVVDSCSKIGLGSDGIHVDSEGVLRINKPDSLKLHSLMLKLEEHGLNMNMTNQTLIEIA